MGYNISNAIKFIIPLCLQMNLGSRKFINWVNMIYDLFHYSKNIYSQEKFSFLYSLVPFFFGNFFNIMHFFQGLRLRRSGRSCSWWNQKGQERNLRWILGIRIWRPWSWFTRPWLSLLRSLELRTLSFLLISNPLQIYRVSSNHHQDCAPSSYCQDCCSSSSNLQNCSCTIPNLQHLR